MINEAGVAESCDTPQTCNKRQLDSTPSPNPSSAKQQIISSSPYGTQPEPSVPTQVSNDINITSVHTPGRKVQLYNLDDNTQVFFEAINITDSEVELYSRYEEMTFLYQDHGPIYKAGFRVKF